MRYQKSAVALPLFDEICLYEIRSCITKFDFEKKIFCMFSEKLEKVYQISRLLLGATIAPNLMPRVLKKIFSFEMVKMTSV